MQESNHHTLLDQHVIRTLIYYDIFNYPLKANEVFRFLGMNSIAENDVVQSLNNLVDQLYISKYGEFYSMRSQSVEENISRRIKGNDRAMEFLPIAEKQAKLISKFPFVRAVMASGSFSKNFMDENSDLDFFIVTAPGRLWISRTLLVLYKRVFLKNSHKLFCVNYFVDSEHLEIEEKNLFTATELATVVPLYGAEHYHKLLAQNNQWLTEFFPNFKPRNTEKVPDSKLSKWKKVSERGINMLFGDALEKMLMRTTQRRWAKLYQGNYQQDDFSIAFKTKKYASKNHPRHFQKKVIEIYQQKVEDFEKRSYQKAK